MVFRKMKNSALAMVAVLLLVGSSNLLAVPATAAPGDTVTPLAPVRNIPASGDCTSPATLELPSVEGVSYNLEDTSPTVKTVTAAVDAGYILAEGATTTWTVSLQIQCIVANSQFLLPMEVDPTRPCGENQYTNLEFLRDNRFTWTQNRVGNTLTYEVTENNAYLDSPITILGPDIQRIWIFEVGIKGECEIPTPSQNLVPQTPLNLDTRVCYYDPAAGYPADIGSCYSEINGIFPYRDVPIKLFPTSKVRIGKYTYVVAEKRYTLENGILTIELVPYPGFYFPEGSQTVFNYDVSGFEGTPCSQMETPPVLSEPDCGEESKVILPRYNVWNFSVTRDEDSYEAPSYVVASYMNGSPDISDGYAQMQTWILPIPEVVACAAEPTPTPTPTQEPIQTPKPTETPTPPPAPVEPEPTPSPVDPPSTEIPSAVTPVPEPSPSVPVKVAPAAVAPKVPGTPGTPSDKASPPDKASSPAKVVEELAITGYDESYWYLLAFGGFALLSGSAALLTWRKKMNNR